MNLPLIYHIYKPIVKRVIHTTADFSYETSMTFSDGVVNKALNAIRSGGILLRYQYGKIRNKP
ncbi:MAG: precorrin-8X methylmutase [Lachnospira eligens]